MLPKYFVKSKVGVLPCDFFHPIVTKSVKVFTLSSSVAFISVECLQDQEMDPKRNLYQSMSFIIKVVSQIYQS